MRAVIAAGVGRLALLLAGLVKLIAIYPTSAYRPEAHYMRGPGPKWREKHLQ